MSRQMKVPQYRAQSSLPKQTGGQMLSAQASPSILGAPGAAQMQMGFMVTQEGLTWGEHLHKIEHATEQSAAIDAFRKYREKALHDAVWGKVESWVTPPYKDKIMSFNQKRIDIENDLGSYLENTILKGVTDKTLRRAIKAQAQQDIITTMGKITPHLTKKYLDYSRVQSKTDLNGMMVEAAQAQPGSNAYQRAIKKITDNGKKWAGMGNWSATDVYKYTIGAEGGVQELRLQQDIISAQGSVTQLNSLYARLISAEHSNEYDKIDPERKLRIIEQVQGDLERAETKKLRQRISKENRTHVNYERNQAKLYDEYAADIAAHRTWQQKPENERGPEPREVTEEMLRRNRQLDPGNRLALIDELIGAKRIINPLRVNQLHDQIDDAVTEAELDAIERQVRADATNRVIGEKARAGLLKSIGETKGKTPEAMKIKQLKALLRTASSKFDKTGVGEISVSAGPEQAAALMQFQSNLDLGQRPIEAFYNAYRDSIGKSTKDFITFALKTIPPQIKAQLPDLKVVPGQEAADFTSDQAIKVKEQLINATEAFKRMAIGMKPDSLKGVDLDTYKLTEQDISTHRLSKADRVSVRQIYAAEIALKRLTEAFRHYLPPAAVPSPLPEDPNPKVEAENEKGFFEQIREAFSPRDDSVKMDMPK